MLLEGLSCRRTEFNLGKPSQDGGTALQSFRPGNPKTHSLARVCSTITLALPDLHLSRGWALRLIRHLDECKAEFGFSAVY
jgi:hypothetical protein